MSNNKLLLCTDMDRTVIPNGVQPESAMARKKLAALVAQPGVKLAYVTGRHQKLVEDAIRHYSLPVPDFVITDVGTKVYRIEDAEWQELQEWENEIDPDWNGYSHKQLQVLFSDLGELKLQEHSKQNTHKLSYYVSIHIERHSLLAEMHKRLEQKGVQASLVWSIDEPKGIGLLDVLPKNATKLHAIQFLQELLGYDKDELLFAGDSGNDLPVLASGVPAVLVANASEEVRQQAIEQAARNGHADSLYLARGGYQEMNGNYAAGVLEGVCHFAQEFCNIT